MGSVSDYSELELLDHVFNAAYSSVATIYLALCTGDPTDAGTGASMNECANANAYTRKAITLGTAASRVITQSGVVTFDQATGSWGTVTHWAFLDSATHGAGNMLAHGAFGASKAIVNGNTPSVASGVLNVTFSAGELGTAVANKLLDLMFRNQAYAVPDTYVALATAIIVDSDTGSTITEVSGGSYARKQVNVNGGTSPTWDVAASGIVDNTHDIELAAATASWGTVVAVCILSAATAGELLWYDNGMDDQAVGDGDTVKFPVGTLDCTLD